MIHEFRYGIFNPADNKEFLGGADEYVESFRFCNLNFPAIDYFNDFSDIFLKFSFQIDLLNDENLIAKKMGYVKTSYLQSPVYFC